MATERVQSEAEELFQAEQEALRRQWARLLKQYEGQYVALYQKRVVGHDADDEALAQRLYATLGDVPFYIAKIERQPTVYNLPSPEVVR